MNPTSQPSGASSVKDHIGKYRWTICALLFAATTINYMDRSILGVLAPTLQYKVFNWTDKDFANINMAFKAAYAIGLLSMGAIVDKMGTKIGYTLSIAIWSVFGMLHAAVSASFSVIGFCLARFGLGFGEAGNFPSAIKTVGEWFPKRERALATGIFNAGSNVGAILAPIVIPLVVWPDGTHWQYAFLTTGLFSAVWVVLWIKVYKRPEIHPRLSGAELAYINSDSTAETPTKKLPWRRVVPLRETWAFSLGKITDAAWWFYLFWGGKFLFDKFGLNIKSLALPLIIIYVVADVGSIGGGWLSSHFIKLGWTVNRSRKIAMLICALCIMPVMFVTMIGTQFNVNSAFFEKLQTATFTTENVVMVDGKPKRQKTKETVPPDVQASLHALDGKSYESAKELVQAVGGVLGPAKMAGSQAALIASVAGNYEINDAFITQLNGNVPDDIAAAIKTLKGRRFDTEQDFLSAATAAVGKAEANRMDTAFIRSSRSDNFYWIAVILIALAAAGHQAWSANLFTLVSDVFPKKATASVIGIGGMVGALSGLVADFSLGQVLTVSGPSGYFFAFLLAGLVYVTMLCVIHVLMPSMTPLDEDLNHVKT